MSFLILFKEHLLKNNSAHLLKNDSTFMYKTNICDLFVKIFTAVETNGLGSEWCKEMWTDCCIYEIRQQKHKYQFPLREINISPVLPINQWSALNTTGTCELTCCDHQVEPHDQCSEWVGPRLVSSSLEERWPGLGCIPGSRLNTMSRWRGGFSHALPRRFDVAPQTRASSYASQGRGCCWTTSGPLACLQPGLCAPVLCILWHSWGEESGTNSEIERARRDPGGSANLASDPTMFKIWVVKDPTLGHEKTPVSPWVFWWGLMSSTAEAFGLNNPDNPL